MKLIGISVLIYYIIFISKVNCQNSNIVSGMNGPVSPGKLILCTSDKTCLYGKCIDGICFCNGKQCAPSKTNFRSANNNLNCTSDASCPPNFICSNSLCLCKEGYIQSGSVCLEEQTTYGGNCTDDKQCQIQHNLACIESKCICKKDYIYQNNVCIKIEALRNKKCEKDQDCGEYEKCDSIQLKCKCMDDKLISKFDNKCIDPPKNEGDICNEDVDCKFIENLKCIDNTCQCKLNTHLNVTQKSCVLNINLGEECTEQNDECYLFDIENKLNSLVCNGTTCVCSESYKLDDGNNQTCIYSGAPYLFRLNSIYFSIAMICILSMLS